MDSTIKIRMKNEIKTTGFFGFESNVDFMSSFFGAKTWIINFIIAMIGSTTSFILDYMWDDAVAVYVLWVLMGADWTTGVLKGIVNKRFVSYKLWRMPLYFVATSFVLSMSWWMSKTYLVFKPLPAMAMCGFYSVYFVSLLENLGEIGLLPKIIVRLLKDKFGLKKIIEKYSKDVE